MIEMQESRDVLRRARAHRAAKTSDEDFKAWAAEQEIAGGLR